MYIYADTSFLFQILLITRDASLAVNRNLRHLAGDPSFRLPPHSSIHRCNAFPQELSI